MNRSPHRIRTPAIHAALAAAAAVVFTWPLALHLRGFVPVDRVDSLFNAWVLWWNYRHILAAGFAGYWNAPIFAPLPYALALSEHLLAPSLLSAPVFALTRDVLLCYNLLVLFTFFTALTGAIALCRHLGRSWTASWLCGIVFAFAGHRYAQLVHLQVLFGGIAPWVFLFLLRVTRDGRPRDAAGLAISLWLLAFSCLYHAAFIALLLAIAGVYLFFTRRLWKRPAPLCLTGIAGGLAAASMIPIARVYQQTASVHGIRRTLDDVAFYAADATSFLRANFHHRWLHQATYFLHRPENELYPGVAAVTLMLCLFAIAAASAWRSTPVQPITRAGRTASGVCAIGILAALGVLAFLFTGHRLSGAVRIDSVWHTAVWLIPFAAGLVAMNPRFATAIPSFVQRAGGETAFLFLLIGSVAFVLSFGPEIRARGAGIGFGPYTWLYNYVPGFQSIRIPTRLATYSTLALGVLAAGGLDAIAMRIRRRRLAILFAAAAVVLVIADGFSLPIPVAKVPEIPPVYDWLAKQPDGTVLEVPRHPGRMDLDTYYQFCQTRHAKPLVGGYSGFWPGDRAELMHHLKHDTELAPWLAEKLAELRPRYIVVHTTGDAWKASGRSPGMFRDAPQFERIYDDGRDIVLTWK